MEELLEELIFILSQRLFLGDCYFKREKRESSDTFFTIFNWEAPPQFINEQISTSKYYP